MTESCSCTTAHPPDKYDYKSGHIVGSICASTEVKIIDLDGNGLGINEPGEILARGPQITMGYLNKEKATAENFDRDGFLHTGDQGIIDEEGMLTITDSVKEMIKAKGIAVAPAELENHLLGRPKVEGCAVVDVSGDYSGELPKAYVSVKSGVEESKEVGVELIKYVRHNKVRHKWITGGVTFVPSTPKSASGKVLRRILRDKSKEQPVDEFTIIVDNVKWKSQIVDYIT